MAPQKIIIQIAGPTAVGKTALAIVLAQKFNTEIISYDSRQCYKELAIGVARPSEEELEEVPHHFIASHSIHDSLNAAWYEQYALQLVQELFQQHPVLVMVGGTGLYWNAFANGIDFIPEVDPSLRAEINATYEERGIDWLAKILCEKDPAFAAVGEMKNPQRMLRALEVVTATGKSILTFRKQEKQARDFQVISIGLELPRQELVERINARIDLMLQYGLLEEVRSLTPFSTLNALQTVGYSELFSCLRQELSLEDAIEKIKVNTRQYAKRQMTWFKRDPATKWFAPSQQAEIIQFVEAQFR